jgi:hypothetical protein
LGWEGDRSIPWVSLSSSFFSWREEG